MHADGERERERQTEIPGWLQIRLAKLSVTEVQCTNRGTDSLQKDSWGEHLSASEIWQKFSLTCTRYLAAMHVDEYQKIGKWERGRWMTHRRRVVIELLVESIEFASGQAATLHSVLIRYFLRHACCFVTWFVVWRITPLESFGEHPGHGWNCRQGGSPCDGCGGVEWSAVKQNESSRKKQHK